MDGFFLKVLVGNGFLLNNEKVISKGGWWNSFQRVTSWFSPVFFPPFLVGPHFYFLLLYKVIFSKYS